VESRGKHGGLALFWDENIQVDLLAIDDLYIDVSVRDDPLSDPWRATFVYREPRVEDRHRMWEILQRLKTRSTDPWIVIGDFNEAMWQYEHFSETKRGEKQMADFREVLEWCGLRDVGFSGVPWTYNNNKPGSRNVKVRLDRGVANQDWLNRFFDAAVIHLTSPCSDHCPLLLQVQREEFSSSSGRQQYYEIMWEREASLGEQIQQVWEGEHTHGDLGVICQALKNMLGALKHWSLNHFGSVRKELEKLRAQLASMHASNSESGAVKETIRAMNEMLYREEMLWLQRSRVAWLREGDRNTKFFHQRAAWRARKNRIMKLRRGDGEWVHDKEEMKGMVNDYFRTLYEKDENVDPQVITGLFEHCVTNDINDGLCKPFTEEEIGNALFQIGPLKAPGPDGFPARFFQRNWGIIKEDVVSAVRRFFVEGRMPEGVNDTAIVLIPMVPYPENLKDYRPISLCNVMYKVVSKCLVNRLRPILDGIISESQSAFIPGRMITDNALIDFECIHAIQQDNTNRSNICAYKLDLAKAYDRVDWKYLESVLTKLVFHRKWVQWVMECVTIV
jgi:hypothetical protein